MAKDKKKKKKDKKRDKDNSTGLFSPKVAKRLQDISRNPLVADVVAATLIGAASALKDSKKAHQLAAKAGEELEELAHRGAKSGNILWQLALDVGRMSLETLAGQSGAKRGSAQEKAKPATSKAAASPKRSKSTAKPRRKASKRKAATPRDR